MSGSAIELFTTYKKEVTLIVVTAVATLLSTKVLPALGSLLKQIAAYGWAVCSGRGKEYRFLRKYLQWVVNEHRYSPVIPSQMLDPQKLPRVPRLEDVYIRLQLRSSGGEQLELPVQSLLQPGSKTVVLGDPGAGKTTYLRYLALIQANRGLSSILHLRARRRLREQLGSDVRRIPVLIPLNRLYRDGSEMSRDLLGVALGTLPDFLQRKCPAQFFEKLLEGGDVVMLLDGLDEIASADQRLRASTAIAALANAAHSRTSWIVTSRVVGYKPKLQEQNFGLAMVQHLTTEQVERFVRNWYTSKCESAGYGKDEIEYQRHVHATRAQHLVDTLVSNVGLRSLATSPMLVSLITMLHSVRLELPENRALLYRDCVELLAGRWDTDRGVTGESAIPATTSQKITFLTSLAWRMHTEKRRETRESELESLLTEHLSKIVASVTRDVAKAFIDVLLERSGIIISRGVAPDGDRLLAFSHLSFQEYLTSRSLQALSAREGDVFVIDRHSDSWWREPILLRMAQMEFPLVLTAEIYNAAREQAAIDGLVFAGYSLAEVQADKQNPIFERVLSDLVFVASAGTIDTASPDAFAFDRNNLFLRYLIGAVEEVIRLHGSAATMLFAARLRRTVDSQTLFEALQTVEMRSDGSCFERLLVAGAPRLGASYATAFRMAVRFPGGAESLIDRASRPDPMEATALNDATWDELIRLSSRGFTRMYAPVDITASWKSKLIAWAQQWPASLEADSALAYSRGMQFISYLQQSDLENAALELHMRLCGGPFASDDVMLADCFRRAKEPAVRLLAVSAALLRPPAPALQDMLAQFVSSELEHAERAPQTRTAAWSRYLVLRSFEALQHWAGYSRASLDFVLSCLATRSVDGREFALRALWSIRDLDENSVHLCVEALKSDVMERRWGAVLALANARGHANESVMKAVVAQLYEREYRMQGSTLRDVAAYTLMRLGAAPTAPAAAGP